VKLLFFTDIHGNRDVYLEGFALAEARGAAVLLGGDLMPDPFGHPDPVALYREEAGFFAAEFAKLSKPVYLVYGNHDYTLSLPPLEPLEAAGRCRILHGKAAPLEPDLWIAGYPSVPVTPGFPSKDFDRRDDPAWVPVLRRQRVLLSTREKMYEGTLREVVERPSIEEDLARLALESDPARTIYLMHSPPADTALDHMYGGGHVGSRAIRRFIERFQPPVTLHGHIHEAPQLSGRWHQSLGRTLMINPGSSDQWLHAVLFDTEDPGGTLERLGAAT